jgi:hypothetical protein
MSNAEIKPISTFARTQFSVTHGVNCACCPGARLNFLTPQVAESSVLSGDSITPSTPAIHRRAMLLGFTPAAERLLKVHTRRRYGAAGLAAFAVLLGEISLLPPLTQHYYVLECNHEAENSL